MEFATYKCSACGKEFNVIVGYSYGYNYSTRTHEAIARHNWTGCTDNEDWAATHLPLCEECRQKEAARIAKEAKKQGLPELKGKPDDVALGGNDPQRHALFFGCCNGPSAYKRRSGLGHRVGRIFLCGVCRLH